MADERVDCLKLNRPSWFDRPDVLKLLDGTERPLATWHVPGQPAGEFSDFFVTYDHGEGSDAHELPEDVWDDIDRSCRTAGVACGVVWVTNLAG